MTESKILKLRGEDAEDIQIISAVLQDSIVPVCDIAYREEDKSFLMVTQRLCREKPEGEPEERVCCALTVTGVLNARVHGLDPNDSESMLDLLAIILEPAHCLNFVFAGDVRIRLDLGEWSCMIEDFGDKWPALCHPCHDTKHKD
ncbi:MAG: DUF2948 family protein [Alphaproteobacteria bacterium]|nr:DUF2948 family protein [Alphaproteobacteria bacterium]